MNSQVTLGAVLLGGVVGFIAGVGFAVTRRWFADLRDTKAKIPPLRKDAWSSVWSLAKVGAVVLTIVMVVGWWAYRDVTDDGPTPLVPSRSPSATRTGR